ncbi:hypothetical protein CEXT_434291 [Caerostris extrusa]|uniref:Uncharacterized protein n=1 Tax=Caerostris extrusa TaxID=172846 RepID=A0AAV4Y356_CAEEX|nr:hypothetical protein CEXT_434291 [Caerostris extrusa]
MRSKDGRKLPEEEDVRENFLAPAFTAGARTDESWHTNAARQSMHGEPFQVKKCLSDSFNSNRMGKISICCKSRDAQVFVFNSFY